MSMFGAGRETPANLLAPVTIMMGRGAGIGMLLRVMLEEDGGKE